MRIDDRKGHDEEQDPLCDLNVAIYEDVVAWSKPCYHIGQINELEEIAIDPGVI